VPIAFQGFDYLLDYKLDSISLNSQTQNTLMNMSAPSSRLRLENQVAVATGGTRGIGEGIVRRFAQEGAKVVFSARSDDKGKALEEELGPNVAFYMADAASASETEALMSFVVERFGRLYCVVNNAEVTRKCQEKTCSKIRRRKYSWS
jgi:NADP-dependent 3-hydroxy acid dehydrogenase YdfG